MNLPQMRIARITRLVKYNKTGRASDIVWDWKKEITEELQFLDTDNEWKAIPVVDIFDDSEKRNEEQSIIDKRNESKAKDLALFTFLNTIPDLTNYWHKVDFSSQLAYLLDYENASFDFNTQTDGYTYYQSKKGAIARIKNKESFARGDVLRDYLNPERIFSLFKSL